MKQAVFLVAIAAFPFAAHAKPAPARCLVASAGEKSYSGPCRFLPEAKGSFSIAPVGRRVFSGEVTDISVSLTGPGAAEVSGLTTSGVNSRWGSARRSRRDPACWEGSDFRVCVYR
ncbi:MAG TPA: hypothetical protein VH331_15660 [Allosphingosinicella sp.]|jgi:hypothetical protein|nr:hypothetical protein [Allosphingosinicella sp.]